MRARRYILTGITAIYFGALVGLAFVPGSGPNRAPWFVHCAAFFLVGVLLVLLLGRRRWWAAIAFAVLGSAWIEAAQMVWMPVGYAQASHLALAASGAVAGVTVAVLLTSPRLRSMRVHESHRIVGHSGNREIPQD